MYVIHKYIHHMYGFFCKLAGSFKYTCTLKNIHLYIYIQYILFTNMIYWNYSPVCQYMLWEWILKHKIYVCISGPQHWHTRQGSTTMENFQRMELPTLYRKHWHLLLKKLFYLVKCLEKKLIFSLDKAF